MGLMYFSDPSGWSLVSITYFGRAILDVSLPYIRCNGMYITMVLYPPVVSQKEKYDPLLINISRVTHNASI